MKLQIPSQKEREDYGGQYQNDHGSTASMSTEPLGGFQNEQMVHARRLALTALQNQYKAVIAADVTTTVTNNYILRSMRDIAEELVDLDAIQQLMELGFNPNQPE